jgi:peptide/nickel transport system permease protein
VQFAGKNPTPEQIAEVRRQFGLDKPVWAQYGLFLKHLIAGDRYGWPGLGFSFVTRQPVRDQLIDRLPVTVQLALGAALVWLCIGIPIGIISAVRRRSLLDRTSMLFALFFVSAPVFWLGLMALWLFWYKLHWSPGTGYVPIGQSLGGWFAHMIMPWVVLALLFAAFYARMVRGNLIETMGQDYIRTARVKGLPEWKVILKHGVRASLTPVVTLIGLDLGALLGGTVITETVFNLQGIGQWAVNSVFQGDLPAVVAVTIVGALSVTLMNLIVDIVYAYLDPRVAY